MTLIVIYLIVYWLRVAVTTAIHRVGNSAHNDITNAVYATPSLCADACNQLANCVGFVYLSDPSVGVQGTCWTKSAMSAPVSNGAAENLHYQAMVWTAASCPGMAFSRSLQHLLHTSVTHAR